MKNTYVVVEFTDGRYQYGIIDCNHTDIDRLPYVAEIVFGPTGNEDCIQFVEETINNDQ